MQLVQLVQIMHIPNGNASISLGILGSFVFRLWMGDHRDKRWVSNLNDMGYVGIRRGTHRCGG